MNPRPSASTAKRGMRSAGRLALLRRTSGLSHRGPFSTRRAALIRRQVTR